jgi:hypothetical protein
MRAAATHRRATPSALLLALPAILSSAACSHGPPDERVAKDLQTVESWLATARLTADAWLAGALPRQFAARTIGTAAEELQHQARTVAEDAGARQAPAATAVRGAARHVVALREVTERGDRDAVAARLRDLEAAARAVQALTPQAGPGR